MQGSRAPQLLAVPLFIALFAAPAVVQQGLASRWAPWGLPLLAAAIMFAALAGVTGAAWTLGSRKPWRREREATGETEQHESEQAETAQAETAQADSEQAESAQAESEQAESDGQEAAADAETEPDDEPDPVLSEALDELEPGNYMDLVRGLQEMERHGEALEVLAKVAELKEGDYGDAVARALRRMRRQLPPDPTAGA